MKTFKNHRPEMGVPVWVWIEGAWHIAMLETSMYPLHLPEHERASWSFCRAEQRRALPEDIWEVAMEPRHHPG